MCLTLLRQAARTYTCKQVAKNPGIQDFVHQFFNTFILSYLITTFQQLQILIRKVIYKN